jgi:hypothetical protein
MGLRCPPELPMDGLTSESVNCFVLYRAVQRCTVPQLANQQIAVRIQLLSLASPIQPPPSNQ